MATRLELERENDELVAAVQEARAILDRALGVDVLDDDDSEDDEIEDGDDEE